FVSSRRRHTRSKRDWSSDVCSSDLTAENLSGCEKPLDPLPDQEEPTDPEQPQDPEEPLDPEQPQDPEEPLDPEQPQDPEEPADPGQPQNPEEPADPEQPGESQDPERPQPSGVYKRLYKDITLDPEENTEEGVIRENALPFAGE